MGVLRGLPLHACTCPRRRRADPRHMDRGTEPESSSDRHRLAVRTVAPLVSPKCVARRRNQPRMLPALVARESGDTSESSVTSPPGGRARSCAATASICWRNAISLKSRASRAARYSDVSFGNLILTSNSKNRRWSDSSVARRVAGRPTLQGRHSDIETAHLYVFSIF
jgi:hypothetical protein